MVSVVTRVTSRRALLAVLGAAATSVAATACLSGPTTDRTGSRLPSAPAQLKPAIAAPLGSQAQSIPATAASAPKPADQMDHAAPAAQAKPGANPALSALAKADEMDKHHEAGIKAFPAKTARHGSERLAPRLEAGVKVFDITASKIKWEVETGKSVDAFAYNGMVPGPEIRVTEGERVRVVLKNEMDESTAIHFHGQRTPNAMDGVPFITQPPIKPGQTFTYDFVAKPAGSHMYHSHHNAAVQVPGGLLGAFIVIPKDAATALKYDLEYLMILNDGPMGFTLNGKGFPATKPLTAKVGQKVLIRYMNEGSGIHPMHLHGFPMLVVAKDGYPQPTPWLCDTLNIAPGERWDVIVEPDEPGIWAFHCHILSHAETPTGMFGMVTALIVEK